MLWNVALQKKIFIWKKETRNSMLLMPTSLSLSLLLRLLLTDSGTCSREQQWHRYLLLVASWPKISTIEVSTIVTRGPLENMVRSDVWRVLGTQVLYPDHLKEEGRLMWQWRTLEENSLETSPYQCYQGGLISWTMLDCIDKATNT